ncbi:hypothetical protein [Nocardiopsis sp. LOL_012]|uniref:hypothetical protein n=1 Tax=Nocardiopsis sp. LOL_012 TaxID=3345409 RepID=UPI003A85FDD1
MDPRTPAPPKPMGCLGKALVWTMVFLLPVFTVVIGLFLLFEGLSGRDTLANGPVGTFTPVDKACNRGSCALEGTFTSDDGAVTRQDVTLRDATRIGSGDPLPTAVEGVRLDTGATRPTAYTADYLWQGAVLGGAAFAAFGPLFSVVLAVGARRYQARALAARGHGG